MNEKFLRTAYTTQAILVSLIKVRFRLDNEDEDTAVIRSQMDSAILGLACAAQSLAERGIFAADTDVGGKGGEE